MDEAYGVELHMFKTYSGFRGSMAQTGGSILKVGSSAAPRSSASPQRDDTLHGPMRVGKVEYDSDHLVRLIDYMTLIDFKMTQIRFIMPGCAGYC